MSSSQNWLSRKCYCKFNKCQMINQRTLKITFCIIFFKKKCNRQGQYHTTPSCYNKFIKKPVLPHLKLKISLVFFLVRDRAIINLTACCVINNFGLNFFDLKIKLFSLTIGLYVTFSFFINFPVSDCSLYKSISELAISTRIEKKNAEFYKIFARLRPSWNTTKKCLSKCSGVRNKLKGGGGG